MVSIKGMRKEQERSRIAATEAKVVIVASCNAKEAVLLGREFQPFARLARSGFETFTSEA
jgi:hypothetical protein